ncbi:MAG: NAD(P)-dependent oxidoreductase [Candidatus Woesearchaeota archaeon]
MDIGLTGADNFLGTHMLASLKDDSRVSNVTAFDGKGADLLDKQAMETFVSGKDVIIHLAAVHRAEDIELMRTNLLGTLSLVNAIKEKNPDCRLLFSSSFQVYKESKKTDIIDETFPTEPNTTYGFSKKFEEELILSQINNSAVFRISNEYGPGCRPFDNSVIATFIHLAKEGKGININGSGDQSKDFVHVTDVVDAFIRAVFSEVKGIFNICTGESISINRIVDLLKGRFPELEVTRNPESEEGSSTKGSYEKAKKLINWKPKTAFKEGIKECM